MPNQDETQSVIAIPDSASTSRGIQVAAGASIGALNSALVNAVVPNPPPVDQEHVTASLPTVGTAVVTSEENWGGHAVLQIAVPALEEFILAQNRHYDARFVSEDPLFHHAHITVLAPLTSWDSEAIGRIAAQADPFEAELVHLSTFPNGIIYLALANEAPVRALTHQLWAAHPEVVPNGAPDPTPHLTLDLASDRVSQGSLAPLFAPLLPISCPVRELELVWYESGNCHWLASWPLGAAH